MDGLFAKQRHAADGDTAGPADLRRAQDTNLGKSRGPYHGNTTKVVLVETNPGYGPDWSHPGTGKVESQLCP
jgi:hypothetical protein